MNIERKKKGKQFVYMNKGSIIKDKKILDRINKLVIPPAWKDVVIANSSKDKVQCIGVDDKNRKQYKYHSDYVKYKSDKKYYETLIKLLKMGLRRVYFDYKVPENQWVLPMKYLEEKR